MGKLVWLTFGLFSAGLLVGGSSAEHTAPVAPQEPACSSADECVYDVGVGIGRAMVWCDAGNIPEVNRDLARVGRSLEQAQNEGFRPVMMSPLRDSQDRMRAGMSLTNCAERTQAFRDEAKAAFRIGTHR